MLEAYLAWAVAIAVISAVSIHLDRRQRRREAAHRHPSSRSGFSRTRTPLR